MTNQLTVALNEEINFETKLAGKIQKHNIPLETYMSAVADLGFFDSGLMPRKDTGLINYRRGAGWETFVFQVEAGEHLIIWGANEGSTNAKTYRVAMPFRIIIGDHKWHNGKWHLVGARHFYSYKPIKTWSDLLYNCNVPNLNCRGYNGTGVGWICLYHTKSYENMDLMQRVLTTSMRTSGEEAYNDSNMSHTDGARYYQSHGKPEYFYNPKFWAAKTKKDGWKWTTDQKSNLLLRVVLNNPTKTHMASNIAGGTHASLFDLTRGLYSAYYNDSMLLKPHNLMDLNNPFVKKYSSEQKQRTYQYIVEYNNMLINQIRGLKAPGWTPKIEKIKCEKSGKEFPESEQWILYVDSDNTMRTMHKSTYDNSIIEFIAAQVDISKVKLSPTFVDLKDKVWVMGTEIPAKKIRILNLTCLRKDIRSVETPKRSGLYRNPITHYHKSIELYNCPWCEGSFVAGKAGSPKTKGERCSKCIGLIRCPTCSASINESNIRLIDNLVGDIVGMERFKSALIESIKKNIDPADMKPIVLSAPKLTKISCCSNCIDSLTQCMCGKKIPNNSVEGMYQSKNGFISQCNSCAPAKVKPDPKTMIYKEDAIQKTWQPVENVTVKWNPTNQTDSMNINVSSKSNFNQIKYF